MSRLRYLPLVHRLNEWRLPNHMRQKRIVGTRPNSRRELKGNTILKPSRRLYNELM